MGEVDGAQSLPNQGFFVGGKLPIYSSTVKVVQRTPEVKNTSRSVDHLTTTTGTRLNLICVTQPKKNLICVTPLQHTEEW